MRSSPAYLSLLLVPISALQVPPILAPFYEPYTDNVLLSNESLSTPHELLKRDGNCPANFNSCTTFRDSAGGACCTAGSFCTTDKAKNVACCPTGASCTGSLNVAAATTTGAVVFGAGTTTTGAAFGTTTTTSATTAATITNAATVSYVANAFFPFPYIPTTYINSAACNSAFEDCQTNFAACTAALDGTNNVGFGVTIVAPNGGVTATPTIQSLGLASATSVCSSLSQQGCYGIVSTNCAQFGTGTEVQFVAGTTPNAARQTGVDMRGCYAVMAGVGLGLAGQMV